MAEHILRGWNDRPKLRANLKQHIPYLLAEADKAAQVVAAIDRGDAPGDAINRIREGVSRPSRAANS